MTDKTKQAHTDEINPGVQTQAPAENRGTSGGQLEPQAQPKPAKSSEGHDKEQDRQTRAQNK
jgi:hypothetical protein